MAATPEELIERTQRLLRQQQEMYGEFSLKMNSDSRTDLQTETDSGNQRNKSTKDRKDEGSIEQNDKVLESRSAFSEAATDPKSEAELLASCTSLDELKALCERAEVLRTDLADTNLVFGVGNPNADLMIIGEAPGENEDRQKEPFVGAAGQLLDKIMAAINFKRSDIYIANILKHRPPNNRDPKPEERANSLPYLMRQIELVDPKLILCVGRISATTLLGHDQSLKSLRQKFHEFKGRELMATYHPAALLRNQQWKRPTWEDVQRLKARYDELGGKP